MLEPDSRPSPSHSAAPEVAFAKAIGRETGVSVSAVKWVARDCRLGSKLRFEVPFELCGRGIHVPSSVRRRFVIEKGITKRWSCSTSIWITDAMPGANPRFCSEVWLIR